MMLAALCAMSAAAVMAIAGVFAPAGRAADLLKSGAAVQFMHAMATLASATVMQIGGVEARRAPAFFLTGIPLLAGSIYARALGAPPLVWGLAAVGGISAGVGWIILARATLEVDDGPRLARKSATQSIKAPAPAE